MCAGVQNVSRPMDMCHEMSHTMPTTMLVAASTVATSGHGIAAADSASRARENGAAAAGIARASMEGGVRVVGGRRAQRV